MAHDTLSFNLKKKKVDPNRYLVNGYYGNIKSTPQNTYSKHEKKKKFLPFFIKFKRIYIIIILRFYLKIKCK